MTKKKSEEISKKKKKKKNIYTLRSLKSPMDCALLLRGKKIYKRVFKAAKKKEGIYSIRGTTICAIVKISEVLTHYDLTDESKKRHPFNLHND